MAIAGVVAGALALGLVLGGSPVDDRGRVDVSYPAGEVKEVRVLGVADVYVDGEPKPRYSTLGAIALFMLSTAAFVTMAALRLAGAHRRLLQFWAIAAAGLAVAGADELLAIHETIGHNLPFLADVPGVKRPDDLVLALYLPAVLAFGWWFRDILSEQRATRLCLIAAVSLFGLSVAGDLVSSHVEEWFELLAGICVAAGLVSLGHHHLAGELRGPGWQRDDAVRVWRAAPAEAPREEIVGS